MACRRRGVGMPDPGLSGGHAHRIVGGPAACRLLSINGDGPVTWTRSMKAMEMKGTVHGPASLSSAVGAAAKVSDYVN
jgi:hypothetical protein